jgi:hypothetical protein
LYITPKGPGEVVNSCNSSIRLGSSSIVITATPVMFPPGRFRLATSPLSTGSGIGANTIGIVDAAGTPLGAVLENCIFYICPMYEFLHSLGHLRRFWADEPMSALPPIATKKADVSGCPLPANSCRQPQRHFSLR